MPKTAGARETERKSCRGDKYDDIISLCLHREFFYFIGFYPIKQNAPRGAHCGEVEYIAKAIRRRRRILRAGFYLYSSYRHKIYKEVKKWQKLN